MDDQTTTVGRVTFGPSPQPNPYLTLDQQRILREALHRSVTIAHEAVHACNCIGPQPGQTKCPCALRAESTTGERMIREGVTINGRRYRLVPED